MAVAKIGAVEYTDLHEALVAGSTAGSVVELLCDVDLAGKTWEPVVGFNGEFDGNGFIISNLTIAKENENNVGLFADVGVSANVKIHDVTIANASVTVTTTAEYTKHAIIAGFVGENGADFANITVSNSTLNALKYVGIIAGHTDAGLNYTNIVITGNTLVGDAQVGALCGYSAGSVNVTDVEISDNTITGNSKTGALWGRSNGTSDKNFVNVVVDQPNNALIGGMYAGTNFFTGDDTEVNVNAFYNTQEGTGTASIMAGTWSPDPTAYVPETGYQVIDNQDGTYTVVPYIPPVANVTIGGETTPYTDLHAALVAGSVAGAVVELVDDVDLTGINWEPIPNFLGKFDGKGYTISNLKIDITGSYAGIFGDNAWGKNHNGICNLVISNADVKATGSYAGVLAAKNGSSGGCVISNVTVCGSISVIAESYVGGLVGHNQYNHIIDCHVIGDGAATSVIGYGEVNEGVATGSGQIGGLVGMTGEGNMHVWNCSVEKVSVKGVGLVGAIYGRMHDSSKLVGCTATDVDVYCAADVATAEVKIGTLVGGFVGGGLAPVINCTATNVKLYTLDGTPIADRWTGTVAEGKNVARGTGVEGDAFTFKFSNPKLTAGTFEVMSDAAVTSLAGWCQTGYAPVANQDGTYTIMQAWNVKFYVGDVVSNAQVVANGEYAKAFAYDTETIEAWTNAAGVAYTEVAITANTDFFAQVKAAPVITWPTEWPADADADVKAKFATWQSTYGVTSFEGKEAAFLLNADPADVPELKITSIEVDNATGKATIVVDAGSANLATVNGVLYVESSNDLATWNTFQLALPTEIESGDWTVTVNAGKFMKAKVGFKAPVAE